MAYIDDTYRSDRPEAGPTGQGMGAMASTGYFSRAAQPAADPTLGPIAANAQVAATPTLAPPPTAMPEGMARMAPPDAYQRGQAVNRAVTGAGGGLVGMTSDNIEGLANNVVQPTRNFFAGMFGGARPGPISEGIASSATVPRVPAPIATPQLGAATALSDAPSAPVAGPISGAANQGPLGPTTVYGQQSNQDDARLRTIQNANIEGVIEAQSQRQLQERNAGQIAQANAANAGQAADRAAGDARVANFRATNGADMVLAGGNQSYNAQRQGIINGARAATEQSIIANKTANDANVIAGQPVGNPIQDQAAATDGMLKGEDAINRREQLNRVNKTADIQNQLGLQQVEHGKATQGLLARLNDPSLSPKDRQAAQQSYLVALGKDPAQYKIEHSNGPPVMDSLGQLHPGSQYVHIVNTTTGEVQTMKNEPAQGTAPGAGRAPLPDHVAMLKSDPKKYSAMFDQAYGPGAATAALGK